MKRYDHPFAVGERKCDLRAVARSGIRLDGRDYPILTGLLDRNDLYRVRPNRLRPVVCLVVEASLARGVVLRCLVGAVLEAADLLSLSETLRGEVLLDRGAGVARLV